MGRGSRGGMPLQLLVRLTPELRRRIAAERRRRGGVSAPELVRELLDQHLPPATPAVDPNQLTIGGQTPPESTQTGGAA